MNKPRIIHTVPVFEPATSEPGWLILTQQKKSKISTLFKEDSKTCRWEPSMKSWFVKHDKISATLDLIDLASAGESLAFCASCKDGIPCEKWKTIPTSGFIRRSADQLILTLEERVEADLSWYRHVDVQPPTMPDEASAASASKIRQDEYFNIFFGFYEFLFRPSSSSPPPTAPGELTVSEAASLLGLSWPCTHEQLAAAFKAAALQAHPDRGGSTAQMARINVARSVLLAHLGKPNAPSSSV